MIINNEIDSIVDTISNPNRTLYEELARDYLLYLGNKKPSKNQLVVFKKLLIDDFSSRLLSFTENLTLQEMKCLYLAFKGKSMGCCATILDIHLDTVKFYRKRGIKKLGCKNMVQAAFVSAGTHFQSRLCEKLINEYVKNIKFFHLKQRNSLVK